MKGDKLIPLVKTAFTKCGLICVRKIKKYQKIPKFACKDKLETSLPFKSVHSS